MPINLATNYTPKLDETNTTVLTGGLARESEDLRDRRMRGGVARVSSSCRRGSRGGAVSVAVLLVSLVALLAFSAVPALAESPWWSLTSGARPAYLRGGVAQDEVKKVVVLAPVFALIEPVKVSEKGFIEGVTYIEPAATATAAEVQEGLEKLYGHGNVAVTGAGALEFIISFKGALSNRQVELETEGATVTRVAEGRPDGEIYVTADNLGDQSVSGASVPVTISDVLPPGLKAVAIEATKPGAKHNALERFPLSCSLEALSCTLGAAQAPLEALAPFDSIEMRIAVDVESAATGEENEVRVSGGEGFLCSPASRSAGSYSDSGCMDEAASSSFERAATGPVASASLRRKITVSPAAVPFGVEEYKLENEEEGGSAATQAGSHPFQQTTSVTLNQTADSTPPGSGVGRAHVDAAALTKDLQFQWPAGLIGNPSPIAQCTDLQFFRIVESGAADECPAQSAVGVATVTINEPSHIEVGEITVPLFNLVPRRGEPARFGFIIPEGNSPVTIDTSVRTGGDYGVTVKVDNITQTVSFLGSKVTVWGAPGDYRHDRQRGWSCLFESRGFIPRPLSEGGLGSCQDTTEAHPPPFLSLPTACTGPLKSTVEGDSWAAPGALPLLGEDAMPELDGCNRLPFSPSIKVAPDGTAASTPTGLNVDVHVPQEESLNGAGLAVADPRDITVALPEGVAVNPSSGDGLAACTEALAGFTGFTEYDPPSKTATFTQTLPSPLQQAANFCPDASKIATVKIKTPILPNAIEGAVYLASQNQNPFGGLVALYVVAEDPVSGVVIKLAGDVHLGEAGQLVTTFADSPQAPFEDAEFHFFGGERAPLTSPARCGDYTTRAAFSSWAGTPPVEAASTFKITSGPHGGPCPGAFLPFSPALTGGTTNINAGSFSPLTTTIEREDGEQNMQSVQLHMPAGLEGLLAGVALCSEANANAGTCGPDSQIGETTVSAGVGADPVSVTGGKIYITEKYAGAPFGLSIVNPVKAGPFDLEHDTSSANNQPACDCVVVRAKIEVNPTTAELTITTDASGPRAIPHLIDGIPVQIKKVNVLINREHFTFNPTNCSKTGITGSIASDEGAAAAVAVPFQPTNCAVLKFAPKFAVSTSGKASRANGASLTAKLSEPPGALGTQANITRVKVDLPKQLPSRLTTLQKACANAQFVVNPAGCPKESMIGTASVTTPLLPVPLEGPVIFVSHGGEAFPSLTIVLQGYGVTVDLVGATYISNKGITSTTFKTVPDVPFNTFTLTLPQGKYSALAANGNLCTSKLTMPTELIAQNGAVLNQSTPIQVTGCAKKKTLTHAQKLARALKACHKKHNKTKQIACEHQARHKYNPNKTKKK